MKFLKILFTLFIVFSLSSCTSLTQMREVEDAVLISAIGFDKSGQLIKMSVEIAYKSEEKTVLSSTGKKIEDCIEEMEKNIPEKLIFSHCGAVVLGQSLTHNTTVSILDYLYLKEDFPLNCYVVSADDAQKILKCEMPNKEPIGYCLSELLSDKGQDTDSRIFVLYRKEEKLLPCFTSNENTLKRETEKWKIN